MPVNRASEPDSSESREDTARYVEVRRKVLAILLAAEAEHVFVDEVLRREIGAVEVRNRPLLQEITYGVLRHRNTLDEVLNFHLKLPVARQKPEVCHALRTGAYQLIYLSRIPPHAAVFQTLEALKALEGVGQKAVGFVNALLQKLNADIHSKGSTPPEDADDPCVLPVRQGYCHFRRPVLPLVRLDRVGHIALRYSHPKWLVSRWLDRFGEEETRALCGVNNSTPRLTARVTSLAPSRDAVLAALSEEGFQVQPGELDNAVDLGRGGDLATSQVLLRGWIQVQDETSIRIGEKLSPSANARVADLCAAPGGKALQLLERVAEGGHLVALDRSEEKLKTLTENLSRIGNAFSTRVAPENPEDLDLGETFGHIVVDAPCSNTGVLARRPEARWRIRSRDFASLADLQGRLLEAAYRHLKPGGRLLYSTCSIESDENEDVIARFCQKHVDLTELGTQLFLPHRTSGDGGFYSLLLRSQK